MPLEEEGVCEPLTSWAECFGGVFSQMQGAEFS